MAFDWAGPAWRKAIRPIVRCYRVITPVTLFDTQQRADWEALADALDVEDTTYAVAAAVAHHHLTGWRGLAEVMLGRPEDVLEYTGIWTPAM